MSGSTFLYHSFPRRSAHAAASGLHSPEKVSQRGLAILQSIFQSGLLCVPQSVPVSPEFQAESEIAAEELPVNQTRFCLTLLSPQELLGHTRYFGPFSVAFTTGAARDLGALPVIYVPLSESPRGSVGLNLIGHSLVRRLMETQFLLEDLVALKNDPFASSLNLWGQLPPAERVQLSRALARLQGRIEPVEELLGVARLILQLFCPTEDTQHGMSATDLAYYSQREWRLLTGIVASSMRTDSELLPAERNLILDLDPKFFGPNRTSRGRIDSCKFVRKNGAAQAWTAIDHIIVPTDCLDRAKDIARKCGFTGNIFPADNYPN